MCTCTCMYSMYEPALWYEHFISSLYVCVCMCTCTCMYRMYEPALWYEHFISSLYVCVCMKYIKVIAHYSTLSYDIFLSFYVNVCATDDEDDY